MLLISYINTGLYVFVGFSFIGSNAALLISLSHEKKDNKSVNSMINANKGKPPTKLMEAI